VVDVVPVAVEDTPQVKEAPAAQEAEAGADPVMLMPVGIPLCRRLPAITEQVSVLLIRASTLVWLAPRAMAIP